MECGTLVTVIRSAYVEFGNGMAWPVDASTGRQVPPVSHRRMNQAIQGGPNWINSGRYTIEAKADGAQSMAVMRGPMMQTLLEDRFKLRTHRETKKVPVYELRVAKGGPKLQRAREGSCLILSRDHPPAGLLPRICGGFSGDYMYGTTMANLCQQLSAVLDRDVIDKTGIEGAFDIHFEGPPAELAPSVSADGSPAPGYPGSGLAVRLEGALPKLGLKLDSAESLGEFIVIDHVERPDAN